MADLPQTLVDVNGPMPPERISGAVASLGSHSSAVRQLADGGLIPPDVLTGMTLFLLAAQPRSPRELDDGRASPIAGGVWVREQVTYHRPMRSDEIFVVSGETARRFVRKGRRYGVTTSRTHGADGSLLVSNCTTGLLSYRADDGLPDSEEGRSEDDLAVPGPDASDAAANPAMATLRALRVGDRFDGPPIDVTFEMMRTRDGARPNNPIHSDRGEAERAGLAAPIAGGSHVLAFVLETLMQAWGPESLLHGTHVDVRWFAPTFADTRIVPSASVARADPDEVAIDVLVTIEGSRAMAGQLTIPLGPPA